jgi:WD40 repeat protein
MAAVIPMHQFTETQSTTLDTSGDIEVPQCPGGFISEVSFSPREEVFGAGSWDHKVRVGRIGELGVNCEVIYHHTDPILSTHFSEDGGRLVSGSTDGTAIMIDLQSGKHVKVAKYDKSIEAAKFVYVNGSEALATTSKDKTLKYWDLKSICPGILTTNHNRSESYNDSHHVSETVLDEHKGQSYGYCNAGRKRCHLRFKVSDGMEAADPTVRL